MLFKVFTLSFFLFILLLMSSCTNDQTSSLHTLVIVDPGHFHASLVQKQMYDRISKDVYVYAPYGPEVESYLHSVERYNNRDKNPTTWNLITYLGPDYLQKMLGESKGDIMITAGNNSRKIDYIQSALNSDMHVLSDKPMCININGFEQLKNCFDTAQKNKLLLYDIMTERSEITSILQRELALIPQVFGQLIQGSETEPAITKESVHHFYKYISGNPIKRPAWYFDTTQQGEGLADVTTHLIDLIQWECFPEQIINPDKDISILSARRWATKISPAEFKKVTGGTEPYPDFLHKFTDKDNNLNVYANGEINYKIRDIHAKVSVIWNYQAPAGGGDTHYSIMCGSKSELIIRQGPEENYKPQLYIYVTEESQHKNIGTALQKATEKLNNIYPGLKLADYQGGWRLDIPDELRVGHEAHFAQVTQRFLKYLDAGALPDWEIPNMLAKYYTTTRALEMAVSNKPTASSTK